jgi:hypothetical protein
MAATTSEDDVWGDLSECPVCLDALCTVIHSSCGRNFCESCLQCILAKNCKCPMCMAPLSRDNILVIPKGGIHEDKAKCTAMDTWDDDKEEDDEDDEKDPVILAAIESSKAASKLMISALTKHREGDLATRLCCYGSSRIIVKHIDFIKRCHTLDLDVTITALRKCLALQSGVCPEQIRLIHKGSPLYGDRTLRAFKFIGGETIHMILQMRGS